MLVARFASASQLSNVISQPVLNISRSVKAAVHQLLNALLSRGTAQSIEKGAPLRYYLGIWWQTCNIDQVFCCRECLLVERCDSAREIVHKIIQFLIRQRAIDIAPQLRQIAADVVRAEQHLQGSSPTDESRQSRHRSAAGHQTSSDLPLGKDGFFAACKAHVGCQGELTANACCSSANQRNGNYRQSAYPGKHVR